MTAGTLVEADRAQLMLNLIHREQEARCREIRRAAEKKARELLHAARTQARVRVRAAVATERQRMATQLSRAQARIHSRNRKKLQARQKQLLAEGWPLLRQALRDRWMDKTARTEWCAMLMRQAGQTFLEQAWQISHPPGWPSREQAALSALLEGHARPSLDFIEDPDIEAGLRFEAGHACLDGTASGLTARRGNIESLLLAALPAVERDVAGHG